MAIKICLVTYKPSSTQPSIRSGEERGAHQEYGPHVVHTAEAACGDIGMTPPLVALSVNQWVIRLQCDD
jgi:hypothetical protein